jgi:hypothetical protein
MNPFCFFPCEYKVPCDTFQCYNRATFFLGREDAPKSTLTKVCEQCANELMDSAHAIRGIEAATSADPVPEPLPFEDHGVTVDGKPIEELSNLELKRACKNLGITGYSDKKREELVRLIEEATSFTIETN